MSSLIGWLDGGNTWNPIRARRKSDGKVGWFCTHVSEACRFCYAEKQNVAGGNNPGRFGNGVRYAVDQQRLVDIFLDEKTLCAPLHWKKPQAIFPCSMTDLYAEWVPDEWLDRMYAVMALTPHFYIVLTKRSARRREYLTRLSKSIDPLEKAARDLGYTFKFEIMGGGTGSTLPWPIPNMIEMASFGTQAEAEKEVPILLQTPAAMRGVSAEPILEPIDLTGLATTHANRQLDALRGIYFSPGKGYEANTCSEGLIVWTIGGGESGLNARTMEVAWAYSLYAQCRAAGVPFYMKQDSGRFPGRQGRLPDALWNAKEFPKGFPRL